MQRTQKRKAGTGMLAYQINGRLVKMERCAADMYIIRNIPGVFDNMIAVGAVVHKDLVQKFLDSYAAKFDAHKVDLLDVDFSERLPAAAEYCRGCVYWNGKGCDAGGEK